MSFPFEGQYTEEVGFYKQPSYSQVRVVAILAPRDNPAGEYSGLICRAKRAEEEIEVALVDLEVDDQNPNFPLIEDYWYWIWNWRFDPRI